MSIKTHIQLTLVTILLFFAANFAVNFWSNHQKEMAISQVQNATHLQSLTTDIKQRLGDLQQQFGRLVQIGAMNATSALSEAEQEKLNAQSAEIAVYITALENGADGELRQRVQTLKRDYAELAGVWRNFLQDFGGGNHVQALAHLALNGEPLGRRVLYEELSVLEEQEQRNIVAASKKLQVTQWWTENISLITFFASLFVTSVLALLLYRRVAHALKVLKQGGEAIQGGDTAHQLALQTRDEFGEIAQSVNSVAQQLHTDRGRKTELEQSLTQCESALENQCQISASLLRNILPSSVAEEFKQKGAVEPMYLEDVTIIFTDFVGFSASAEKLAADELVHLLHKYFSAFDEITQRYGLEKLKTIGDSYMCAGGLPERNPSHPVDAVMAAMEIVRVVNELRAADRQQNWSIRIGIHTGHLIAGMVGTQKFSYDIWGESVNFASRVESSGEPNQIALSGQTYSRIKDFFECEKRTKTHAKVTQKMELYFVKGFQESLLDDSSQLPPAPFLRRYRSYFQKDPPSFPTQSIQLLGTKSGSGRGGVSR